LKLNIIKEKRKEKEDVNNCMLNLINKVINYHSKKWKSNNKRFFYNQSNKNKKIDRNKEGRNKNKKVKKEKDKRI